MQDTPPAQTAASADEAATEPSAPTLDGQDTDAAQEEAAAEGGAWDTADKGDQASDEKAATEAAETPPAVLVLLDETQLPVSFQGASAAADAQQQLADAAVREQGDKDAADAKQEALVARQSVEKGQQDQISRAQDKFQSDKSAAEETMRAAKAQALVEQKAELKKRSEELEKEKLSIDEVSVCAVDWCRLLCRVRGCWCLKHVNSVVDCCNQCMARVLTQLLL